MIAWKEESAAVRQAGRERRRAPVRSSRRARQSSLSLALSLAMGLLALVVAHPAWAAATLPPVTVSPSSRAALAELTRVKPGVKVGEWVTYAMGEPGRQSFLRFAVVGEEKDPLGRDAYWLEVDMGSHPALASPLAQLRMLVSRAEGFREGGVTRLFVAVGAGKPQEVQPESVKELLRDAPSPGGGRPAAAGRDLPHGLEVRPREPRSLLTQAGSIRATPIELVHRQTVVRRLWTSPEIPVLGLVRIEIPGLKLNMDVHAHGLDARPQMVLPEPKAPRITLDPVAPEPSR